jgi:hypothetical protein
MLASLAVADRMRLPCNYRLRTPVASSGSAFWSVGDKCRRAPEVIRPFATHRTIAALVDSPAAAVPLSAARYGARWSAPPTTPAARP